MGLIESGRVAILLSQSVICDNLLSSSSLSIHHLFFVLYSLFSIDVPMF